MKSLLHPARLLLVTSLLALSPSPAFAQSKTEALKNAQDELAILKNKYTDEHPQVVEQKLRITQLQRRVDDENQKGNDLGKVAADVRARRAARQSGEQSSTTNPIIRTEIRLLTPKADGGFDVIAAPTLISQSGQDSSLSFGAYSIVLNSSVDDQSNITTSIELTTNNPDGKPAEKTKLPRVTNRPGITSTLSVKDQPTVEITATLVDPKGISVDFPGGSLSQLLTAISKSSSEPFNLIASSDALALAVPKFSVRNARPRDLALALDQLLVGYRIDFAGSGDPGASPTIFTLRSNESYPAVVPAVAVSPEKKEQFRSYPLALLGNKFPVDEVIATLNAAWTLDPGHRPADLRIKHHAATNILLVSSSEQSALNIVEGVMQSLALEAQSRQSAQPKP
ncbi:MAG: hypothetical protein QM760_23000 [Nibricoccus sp.]